MLKGHQGATIYTFDEIRDGKVEVVKKHAVFMPIHFGNTFWSVVVASPEDEIIASLEDFRNNLILVIGLLLLGGVLFSYYGLKAWFIIGEGKKRHRAEEALRESEERFKTLSDKTPLGMCLIDIDGRYEYVNPAFVKIFGYDLSDIPTGKEWFRTAYPDPEYRREVIADWKEDLSSYSKLEIRPRTYEVRCKGGAFRTIMFRPVTLPTGKQLIIYEDITERKQAEKQLQDTLESLRKAVGATMQVMVAAVETRDPYTSGHQKRSADLARAIAAEMGLPPEKIEGIRMAGSIHDIGKLSIPAEILSKPTKLSEIEFSLIKEHAKKGYEMLKDVESPWPLAEIVRQHHERMDGSGYPRNLKGDDILIEARILSVADVVEAMASHRPYRPGLGIDAALNEIEKNRGILYDSTAADACLRLFRENGFKLEGT
ncbi:MAG: HD domain-containing phosphohydrolase [Thermodesulfobacteriota bacterium]